MFSDEETGEMVPPERAERVPDYHMGNDHTPMYVSPRLCGKLFREFKAIDDVLKISEERDELFEISIDESIKIDGYMEYMVSAKEDLARYNAQLRVIIDFIVLIDENVSVNDGELRNPDGRRGFLGMHRGYAQ